MAGAINRIIARHARLVTLRFAPDGTGDDFQELEVRAHVMGYQIAALVPGTALQQGDREMRIAQAELDAAGAPRPLRVNDQVVLDGATAAILSAEVRVLGGEPALVVCQIRG